MFNVLFNLDLNFSFFLNSIHILRYSVLIDFYSCFIPVLWCGYFSVSVSVNLNITEELVTHGYKSIRLVQVRCISNGVDIPTVRIFLLLWLGRRDIAESLLQQRT